MLHFDKNKHRATTPEKNNNSQTNQSRSFLNGTDTRTKENDRDRNQQNPNKKNFKPNTQILENFIKEVSDNSKDVRNLKPIIADNVYDVANTIYDISMSSDQPQSQIVFKTIAVFGLGAVPKTMKLLVTNNVIELDDDYHESVMSFLISRILIYSEDIKMDDDTIDTYVSIFNSINKTNITMLKDNTGIDDDLALDLLLSYPIAPSMMNNIFINENYEKFILRILDHSEENQTNLNADTIAKIFNHIFGDNLTKGKPASRMIGKYLGNKPTSINNDDKLSSAIYVEFVKFLYTTLNSYDDESIRKTISFIKKQRAKGYNTLYDENDSKSFDNINNNWE